MNKTPLLLALLTLTGALAVTIPDASAQGRVRGRAVAHTADGGRAAVTGAAVRGEHGAYARGRKIISDGQGNVAGRSGGYVQGADGGSAGRQGSAFVEGPNGGSTATSGSVARDADGSVNGSRSTTATGASGNTYNGSTTVNDGQISHTGTCTNAAGETIACRSGN